jgi:hypothetical protein
MNEIDQAPAAADGNDTAPSEQPMPSRVERLLDHSGALLGLFLSVGLVVFIAAFLTVHRRPPQELAVNGGSLRSRYVLSHWLNEGYFHYFGLTLLQTPGEVAIYSSSTGGYLVSAFVLEEFYMTLFGRYSWRLIAIHNELVSLLLSALLGLLAFRVSRRIGLDMRLAFAAGASIVIVMFTFPDNLALYWEMSAQAYWLLFATIFLLVEERCLDGDRTHILSLLQAIAAFLMTIMESIAGLAFVSAMAATIFLLEQRRGSWKRFLFLALAPFLAALMLHGIQSFAASRRFPQIPQRGSTFMVRSGLDGESLYYGDHLDIAGRRVWARLNWPANRKYLFRWTWVFLLGSISTMIMMAAYLAGRVPRIAIETLTWLAGAWLLYAAVFSQSLVIHPYLHDVMLFAPLSLALFAFVPALVESRTRGSGAILLIVVFCAIWYAFFQMRLYALRYPMPGTKVGPDVVGTSW